MGDPVPWLIRLAIAVALLGWFGVRWLGKRRRQRAAESWPTVEGLSQGGRVVLGPQESTPMAEIDYSYSVNGEYYAGSFLCGPFQNADRAEAIIDEMKKGRKLLVRYDPSHNERSVVRDEDQPPRASAGYPG